jgi:serine/threonine protein kinase
MERYAIVRTVGRGAFGTVMAARDTATGALVAVKRIRDALEDQDQCKLLQRELKLLRHLRGHENIINIQDIFVGPAGQADFTDIFIVTNKMDTDLSRVIWSAQTVSYEHVRYFAYQVLRGRRSCTGTSSRRTCSSTATATCASATWGSPG